MNPPCPAAAVVLSKQAPKCKGPPAFGRKFLPAAGPGVLGKMQMFFCWKETDGPQPSSQLQLPLSGLYLLLKSRTVSKLEGRAAPTAPGRRFGTKSMPVSREEDFAAPETEQELRGRKSS